MLICPTYWQEVDSLLPPRDETLRQQLEDQYEVYEQIIPPGAKPADHQSTHLRLDILSAVLRTDKPVKVRELNMQARHRFGLLLRDDYFNSAVLSVWTCLQGWKVLPPSSTA